MNIIDLKIQTKTLASQAQHRRIEKRRLKAQARQQRNRIKENNKKLEDEQITDFNVSKELVELVNQLQSKAERVEKYLWRLGDGLDLKKESRCIHIAYCLAKGKDYKDVEQTIKPFNSPNWDRIRDIVKHISGANLLIHKIGQIEAIQKQFDEENRDRARRGQRPEINFNPEI